MAPDGSEHDIISTGVDGQPTRMRATRCERAVLASASSGGEAAEGVETLERGGVRVFTGTCPMMAAVGWAGTPAALIGLDLLKPQRGGGSLVLDFDAGLLRVVGS